MATQNTYVPISYGCVAPRPSVLRRLIAGRRAFGLADQILISGSNFITMVLVGRGLGIAGFGQFSLVYNILLLANMIQASLVTQPHNVLGAGREPGGDYNGYTASTAVSQGIMAAAQALLALAFVAVARVEGWHCAALLLALAPAIAFWQLQEFFRRTLYTEGRMGAALLNDIVSYGGQAAWIAALWWSDRHVADPAQHRLTGPAAMYALAITSAVAAAIGLFQVRASLRGRPNFADWIENWHFGKWLLGSDLLTYFSSLPMYMNMVALMVGEAASGYLKASQTLFGPTRVISFYLATVLPIQFSRSLAAGGGLALQEQLKKTSRVVLPLLGLFCLAIGLFAAPLLTIFGREFAAHPRVLALYAVVAFLTYGQMILTAALTAKRRTRAIFFSTLWGAGLTLLISWPLIKAIALDGALVAMILTGLAMTAMYWKGYRQSLEEDLSAQRTSAVPPRAAA
ncbi:MAG TPA: lipopolysaccharide biosynthesis protein [Tepidisphaeraceae bacterium]|jgi:O-antigen/teichoic acid export membrane protein|nr:lipopolysaccharide biosynthesis protein [Tepidisphaeraceae bacterium]